MQLKDAIQDYMLECRVRKLAPRTIENYCKNLRYPAFVDGKMNVNELARVCGVSRPTVYKYINLMRG